MANTTGSTASSMTSTSHTLTHEPNSQAIGRATMAGQQPRMSGGMETLSRTLEPSNRHVFIQPSIKICDAALESVKKVLDSVAAGVCDEQAARLRAGKRKRGDGDAREELRIRRVHTEGFGVDQVWEQARRVIDALRGEVARELDDLGVDGEQEREDEQGDLKNVPRFRKTVRFDEDGLKLENEDESDVDDVDDVEDVEDVEGGLEEDDLEMQDDGEEDNEGLMDDEVEEAEDIEKISDPEDEDDYQDEEKPTEIYMEDPNGLNDGFFSIDQFNKQTEFLEQQDATGDPYTGEASDEEDIDWDADPLSLSTTPASKFKRADARGVQDEEDLEEESDEDGPTFRNVDLNAPDDEGDDDQNLEIDQDDFGATENTNDILYKDFFEPPPRKVAKGARQSDFLDRQARKSKAPIEIDEEAEMERAMADVRRDLFDDNSEHEDSGDALSDVDAADPKSRKSAHERRQAKLAEEIRRLEAASVAKREWTLSGEARAADRPLNSLLEEDLDFERTGKPVPVITAEVSESIEELIKRRIIAQEFDEVIRRRPDSESVPSTARRGMFELSDDKPQQSLAEMYEEEHVKATNPDTYISKEDEKLKNQHQEIEMLWKEVSAKLDSLSSWHYKPKPPAPSLTVVADIATVAMEDAQPTTASGMAGADSMLAPQEIYKAGQEKQTIAKGEVVLKSGAPVARQEMTREQKLRRRRREKERIKKRGGLEVNKRSEGKRAKEKRDTVDELKKGGVKIISKKGDVTDVNGNKLRAAPIVNGAGSFKL